MTWQSDIQAALAGAADAGGLWLPDLTLWHHWHSAHGTLPAEWSGFDVASVAAAIGAPAWVPVRPWTVAHPGVAISTAEADAERVVVYDTPAGQLTARWMQMPDGDWWQTEYPVKSGDDLPAMRAVLDARQYVPRPESLERAQSAVGERGVVAAELPRRAYSDVLHVFLGWSEGLMLLLGDEGDDIVEMVRQLEVKTLACAREVAELPGAIAFSPDNLDGQFVTPAGYREHMSAGYARTAELMRAAGKTLVVHAGAGIRRLLPLLAADGVGVVEGISGPPQGDATLGEARQLAGGELVLWGGVPQDLLLESTAQADFEAGVIAAAREARAVGKALVGVADQVPTAALPERLAAIARLVASA